MESKYPSDASGRLVGFIFLALIPFVVLVPSAPVSNWLAQDLILRGSAVFVFFICAWNYLAKPKPFPEISFDFLDTILLLLTAWVLISVKNSQEAFNSFYAFRSFLALVLWWFSLKTIWKKWPGIYPVFENIFFATAVAGSLWLMISTFGHWWGIPCFSNGVPHQGLFPNPNIASGFLALVLIWGTLGRLHHKPVNLWGLGIVFAGWCSTESRAALIALLFVIVLYLVLHMREVERKLSRWTKGQWAAGTVSVLVAAVLLAPSVDRLFRAGEMDPRAFNRMDLWWSCLRMIKAEPLLGFGPGVFSDAFAFYKPVKLWNVETPYAHCEYLQVAVDCGLAALGLVFVFLWGLLRETGSGIRSAGFFQKVPPAQGALECAFYIIVFEAVHNSVDFTFHEWSHRLVLGAFVTYGLAGKKPEDDLWTLFRFSRRTFFVSAAILALLVLWILGVGGLRDYGAKIYYFKSDVLQAQGQWDEAEKFGRMALRLRPNFMGPWNLLGALEDARAQSVTDPGEKEKHFEAADQYFDKAAAFSPYSLTPQENRIQNLVMRRRFSQALDLQRQLIERTPGFPDYYVNLGAILMKMGRPGEALPAAQKSIDLAYYFLPAYFLKAQSLEALGKKKQALQAYEDAGGMLKDMGMGDPSGQVEPNIQRLQKQK